MHTKLFAVAVALVLGVAFGQARAATIGFEEIPMTHTGTPGYDYAYLQYQYGLNWDGGVQEISWVVSQDSGVWFPGQQAHSGNNFAWSNGGTNLAISGIAFTLTEFWARTANITNDISLTVTGYNGGVAVDSQSFTIGSTYRLISLSLGSVDAITFAPSSLANVLFDDLVFTALTPAIPEPQIYALLLAGLGFIGVAARRKRSN
jgi:hypothetical protein